MAQNNNSNNTNYPGKGLSGVLTVAFIVLKVCKVINWSWIWVFSPLWISFAIVALILIIAYII